MGTLFIMVICFGLPGLGFLYLNRKHCVIVPFVMGAFVFFLSQIVLRLPILSMLSSQRFFQIFMFQTIPYFLFLALSAGVFEEVGRWLGYQCMKNHRSIYDAIAFGLGHGAIEAIVLTAIPILQLGNIAFVDVVAGGIERISAMMIHIAFSILIWKGIKNKKLRYVGYAILAHAIFDFMSIYMMYKGISIFLIEFILCITACGAFWFSLKPYIRKEEK